MDLVVKCSYHDDVSLKITVDIKLIYCKDEMLILMNIVSALKSFPFKLLLLMS